MDAVEVTRAINSLYNLLKTDIDDKLKKQIENKISELIKLL